MLMNTTFLEDSFLIKWQSRAESGLPGILFPCTQGEERLSDCAFVIGRKDPGRDRAEDSEETAGKGKKNFLPNPGGYAITRLCHLLHFNN